MGFKIKKTVNGETVWQPIKAKKYTTSKITEYTGTLPITINANGDVLIDYRIYGADGGVGESTENLFNINRERSDDVTFDTSKYIYGARADSNNYTVPTDIKSFTFNENNFTVLSTGGAGIGFIVKVKPSTTYSLSYRCDVDVPVNRTSAALNRAKADGTLGTFWGIYGDNRGSTFETDSDTEYVFIVFRVINQSATYSHIMLTEGSTAPTEYEPYGYKLPMTAYKQEFKVTSDMLDQSNWVLSPPSLPNPSYFIYFDISDFISKEKCDAKIYENFSAGYTPEKLVVALTDDIYTLVNAEYRILNNYGTILNKKFNFSSWDKVYLCIGYGGGFLYNAIKQSKIDELFGNWKILIAPTSQTREAPVYIGENKLGAGEYVSYIEQKIYRDVGGTLTPTDPPVPLPEIPTIKGETIIDYDGEPKPSQMYVKYNSWSGWSDIDDYKMVNGNWTQEVT